MKIASAWSTHSDEKTAATEAYEMLFEKLQAVPQLLLVHSSSGYDNEKLIQYFSELAPGVPLQGGTSCLGVITEAGYHSHDGKGFGLLGLLDPQGGYGVGIEESGGNLEGAVIAALNTALTNSGRPGELPSAIIITSYPGDEERVILAIEKHLGTNVPIIGGTSADNDMSGEWQQFGNSTVCRKGISVATLFPAGEIGYAFHSGYEPTAHRGIVTRAEGRVLYEIDGKPIVQVYNEWTGGLLDTVLPDGGSLIPATSFSPIGRPVKKVGGISYFRLSHPIELLSDQGLLLFTDISEGDEVVLMKGNRDSLATRAGRVAGVAVEAAEFNIDEIEGALVLYCTGCMLTIQERLPEVAADLKKGLHQAPFLCSFTLGEQGCFIGGENSHGNLMIAVLVFGPRKMK